MITKKHQSAKVHQLVVRNPVRTVLSGFFSAPVFRTADESMTDWKKLGKGKNREDDEILDDHFLAILLVLGDLAFPAFFAAFGLAAFLAVFGLTAFAFGLAALLPAFGLAGDAALAGEAGLAGEAATTGLVAFGLAAFLVALALGAATLVALGLLVDALRD